MLGQGARMLRERQSFTREIERLAVLAREFERPGPAKKAPVSTLPPACAQPSPWPDAPCPRSRPSPAVTNRRVARLTAVIREGIENTHNRAASNHGPGLFAGSWDWHSAVHAHWALLSIARVHGDAGLERWLAARLTDKALAAELGFLKSVKDVQHPEHPYGWSWLLLVLWEMDKRSAPPKSARALSDYTRASLVKWLESSSYPEQGTASSPRFNGAYKSWLFTYLMVALTAPASGDTRARLRELRNTKLEPARAQLNRAARAQHDFLDLPAIQALTDRVDGMLTTKPPAYPVAASLPLEDPPMTADNAHTAGAAVVSIWPHAVESGAGNAKACARYHARLNELFSRTDHWADSFEHVSHWVPQFIWMAMWLEAGRP
jgi:hypothetical protein